MRVFPLVPLLAAFLGPLAQAESGDASEPVSVVYSPPPTPSGEPGAPELELATPATGGFHWTDARTHRVDLGVEGGIGLFRLPGTDLGPSGVLRLGAVLEGFRAGNFPVRGSRTTHFGGRLTVSYVPLGWLETFFTFAGASNTTVGGSPSSILTVGDLALGVKAAGNVGGGFFLGVEARALAYPAGSPTELGRYAFGFWPRVLAAFDARAASRYLPFRLHAAAGVRLDWNGQAPGELPLRAAEEYAVGTARFHRFTFGAGAEVPLPGWTPFVEYGLGYPLGGGTLVSPDGTTLTPALAMAQSLGTGLRVTALRDLTFLAAIEVGLNRRVALGMAPIAPFNFFLGVSLNLDLLHRGQVRRVEVVRERERPPPPEVVVEGVVLDAEGRTPVSGALVSFPGSGLPPVASEPLTGRFRTYGLMGREARLAFAAAGYAEQELVLQLAPGRAQRLEVLLNPLPKRGLLGLRLTSEGKGLEGSVQVEGPSSQSVPMAAGATDAIRLELAPGKYTLTATAEEHLSQIREVQLSDQSQLEVQFDLKPLPKKRLVVVKGNKLELSQSVHFASGKARILADSFPLLQQVVDIIVKNGIQSVRIEGHTDNQGGAPFNQKLSAARAAAVLEFLVAQGVDRARLEAVGFGGTRPIAPNLTARGRELNRRVEFIILKR